MIDSLFAYLAGRPIGALARDALDIFITYYLLYRVLLVLRGTRAMQIGVGLGLVFMLYLVARWLELLTVLNIMDTLLKSALIILVVVFQSDIRRGLMRVGSGAWFGAPHSQEARVIDKVVEAATELAKHRTGAIIALEQDANLDEFVGTHKGRELDAAVSSELLVSLFIPEAMNKLHDGAVIIRNLRIAKAGVFFPMPESKVLDQSFGSRHRAAVGITEETDAVVIVVSEERGSISFCFNGNIVANLDGPRLRAALEGVFSPRRASKRTKERVTKPPSAGLPQSATEQQPSTDERPSASVRIITQTPELESSDGERPTAVSYLGPRSEGEATTATGQEDEAPAPLRKAPKKANTTDEAQSSRKMPPQTTPMRAATSLRSEEERRLSSPPPVSSEVDSGSPDNKGEPS